MIDPLGFSTTWSVVATTTEPRQAVERFIAHHLMLGASEVVLFFDDPEDATALILESVRNTRALRCGPAHWPDRGRPESPGRRAVYNANSGASLCGTDWVLHLRVGDFLHCDPASGSVSSVLEGVSPAVSAIALDQRGDGLSEYAIGRRTGQALRFSQAGVKEKGADVPVAALQDLFLSAGTDPERLSGAVRRFVAPGRRPDSAFSHLSTRRGEVPPRRIFQIGMNRCGSKEICTHFGLRGYSYAHWANGDLARDLAAARRAGIAPFRAYEDYDLLSDIEVNGKALSYEGFYDVDHIAGYFPDAVYVLNHRPVADWIASRSRFRHGKYMEAHRQFFGLATDDEVREKWESDWHDHVARLEIARRNGLRVIDWPIYTMRPADFFAAFREIL